MNSPTILVDSSNSVYRCHYGNQKFNPITRKREPLQYNGKATGGIYGFFNTILKCRKHYPDSEIICAFDTKSVHRHRLVGEAQEKGIFEATEGYKGTREYSEDVRMIHQQLNELFDMLPATRLHAVEIEGMEADDIIGSYATKLDNVIICSTDKDFYQLISPNVSIYNPTKDITIDLKAFNELYEGLEPKQMIEIGALTGDTSDNIPGVKGIGEKYAIAIIREHGNLENAFKNFADNPPKRKYEKLLVENKEKARICHTLKTIVTDLDVPDIEYKETDFKKIRSYFEEWGFKSLYPQVMRLA